MLDPDTFTSPETEEVARLAAGAVVNAVDHTLEGPPASRALAVVRPPGHHAEGDRAMGFCFFNNIAIGAAHARANGVDRVAIVDYDVHHGNGTQWTFYDDPSVLFVSSHQYPFYPGTGAASETGRGAGLGFTLNLPLEAGATDDDVLTRYERDVMPRLNAFAPGLLMVSAGFDAHERDPLGGCRLSTGGFRRLTEMLVSAADRLCDGRLVLVTEGGYDLQALQECLDAVIDVCR
jgi:acetoin utilization deacetylase AcuC-like enzyme